MTLSLQWAANTTFTAPEGDQRGEPEEPKGEKMIAISQGKVGKSLGVCKSDTSDWYKTVTPSGPSPFYSWWNKRSDCPFSWMSWRKAFLPDHLASRQFYRMRLKKQLKVVLKVGFQKRSGTRGHCSSAPGRWQREGLWRKLASAHLR